MTQKQSLNCPKCGAVVERFKQPALTVDIVIEMENRVILIERKNPPHGWALPGGFVDYGETVENAAIREAKEETNLEVELKTLLGVYSDPKRDPRGHTVSTVFLAKGRGQALAKDDAAGLEFFNEDNLPNELVFDHARILSDYFKYKESG